MARNLPWKTSTSPSAVKTVAKKKPTASRKKPKQKTSPDSSDEESETNEVSKLPKPKKKPLKIPVQKPLEIESPGEESEMELMVEGLANDDIYMMVEDEFLTTAKKFTRNLHLSALEEMEKAAKMKSKETVAAISRPVSCPMTVQTKRKLQGAAIAKKQGVGVQKLISKVPGRDDDPDDDPDALPAWIGTSLHGLMEAPKKAPPSLTRLLKTNKTTTSKRVDTSKELSHSDQFTSQSSSFGASKAMKQKSFSSEKDDETASDDDEDDLDAIPKARKVDYQVRASAYASQPIASSSTSAFPQPKPKSTSGVMFGALPSMKMSSKAMPSPDSSSSTNVGDTADKGKDLTTSAISAPASKPKPTLAEIKRRLAERRLQE